MATSLPRPLSSVSKIAVEDVQMYFQRCYISRVYSSFTNFGFSLQIKLIGNKTSFDRLPSSSRIIGVNYLSHHACRLHFPSKRDKG